MLLSDARHAVYHILDDDGTGTTSGTRWTISEVDAALNVGLYSAMQIYAAKGGNRLDRLVSVATSSGVGDLTSYAPISIKSVRMQNGNTFYPIRQCTSDDFQVATTASGTLSVRLVAQPAFPASSSSHFTYGESMQDWAPFDRLIVVRAARSLLIKDNQSVQALEREASELLEIITSTDRTPTAIRMPTQKSVILPYSYAMIGHQIQLAMAAQFSPLF